MRANLLRISLLERTGVSSAFDFIEIADASGYSPKASVICGDLSEEEQRLVWGLRP
jgi:hypothetical protein